MRTGRQLRFGLAPKLVLCLAATTAAVILLYAFASIHYQRLEAERIAVHDADRFGDLIRRSTRYLMLRNDREALGEVLNTIGGQPGIRRVRIFSDTGVIRFSTDAREIGAAVNKDAEACFGCHANGQLPTQWQRPDRARILTDASGERNVGVIHVIQNEPACSAAGCHAHPAGQRVLGVIDTSLSLAAVDAQLAAQERRVVRLTLIIVIVLTLASFTFAWWVVGKPVRVLMEGTERLAQGDLEHRLSVHSHDELGELAASFNTMAESLARAQKEVTDWGRTLETRVEEETHKVEQAQAVLIAREKMASLGKLAAAVAHEVNNPLAGILTYARLSLKELEKIQCPPESREKMNQNLHIIERESRRCGNLMHNLLTFARQTSPNRQPAEIQVLISDALTLIRHRAELQSIRIETKVEEGLPHLLCDPDQIRQVILALLVNAVEAMPSGGQLEIAAQKDSAGGVQLRVKDSGEGIPPEVLPQIFEPFFTTKQDRMGTGLGLAIAHSALEQHGGSITVEAGPGAGTAFVVTLPLEGPPATEAAPVAADRGTRT